MSAPATNSLRSAFYACRVLHARLWPRRHRFSYRLFYLAIELDELGTLQRRLRFFSVNRANLFSFWESDYMPLAATLHEPGAEKAFPQPPTSLRQRVLAYCESRGRPLADSTRVTLLTLPRVLGHAFNPVSFYVCRDASGELLCTLAEVTNTYREVKLYFLPPMRDREGNPACGARMPKHFYVSPFSELEVAFDFRVHAPGEKLRIRIDDYEGTRRILHSSVSGNAEALTDLVLLGALLRFPAVTLRVLLLIHWQAFRLWLKRLPYFRKADRPDLQREVRHPHASLKPHPLS